jgi:hypothetical protein
VVVGLFFVKNEEKIERGKKERKRKRTFCFSRRAFIITQL